jgi:hypothetical protein
MTSHTRRQGPKRTGCFILAFALAGGLIAAVAALTSHPASPPTPYQQCVTSIKAEPANQVTGFTPECMRLRLAERQAAIRQVTG